MIASKARGHKVRSDIRASTPCDKLPYPTPSRIIHYGCRLSQIIFRPSIKSVSPSIKESASPPQPRKP